jgi:hypothetical protein
MLSKLFFFIVLLGAATSCMHQEPPGPKPEKTQLEIREFQTRTFEVQDSHLVMKSVLNVLQDDGFMVKSAASDLGFLAATKELGLYVPPDPRERMAEIDFGIFRMSNRKRFGLKSRSPFKRSSQEIRRPSHEMIEATVNVTEFGEKVRVRASFQPKVFDTKESVLGVKPIADEVFYQEFFAKVDKGIFIQQQHI